ncbi:MAG TPA: hypothetical protein VE973_01760 [Candidatus Limnocylindria bacterium]|nr:hypothetical protein [Candidatus Limnocylindria bacterium]
MQITILLLFLLFALFLLFVIFSAFLGFLLTRVPFVPTHAGDIKFIVNELKLSPKDVFYDLGSGNGSVVFMVEKLSGAKTKGFEMTWWTHLWARLQALVTGSKAKFVNRNFFNANWSEANIIYCYLYPPLMGKIEEKFKAEMKPGSIAIVRDFPFPTMLHAAKYYLPKEHEIYVYRKV